ncbi:hypothetical protein [Ottowia thiooxydans]|uniref:hypothetical protein n=1 Tax=Ottowia thiooxydans TaxID=219182 RepID=UPI00041CA594|nr:hypothetical protein [Ottowia thiooxydans]
MTNSVPKLAVEVVWFDDDMLELSLSACSAKFSGETSFYAALDEPAKFAQRIEGFPRAVDDTREYEFGGDGLHGYGGAKVRLSCKDGSGHLLVHVTVYEASNDQSRRATQCATVEFGSVPAAIDSFVEGLRRMQVQVGDVAALRHA